MIAKVLLLVVGALFFVDAAHAQARIGTKLRVPLKSPVPAEPLKTTAGADECRARYYQDCVLGRPWLTPMSQVRAEGAKNNWLVTDVRPGLNHGDRWGQVLPERCGVDDVFLRRDGRLERTARSIKQWRQNTATQFDNVNAMVLDALFEKTGEDLDYGRSNMSDLAGSPAQELCVSATKAKEGVSFRFLQTGDTNEPVLTAMMFSERKVTYRHSTDDLQIEVGKLIDELGPPGAEAEEEWPMYSRAKVRWLVWRWGDVVLMEGVESHPDRGLLRHTYVQRNVENLPLIRASRAFASTYARKVKGPDGYKRDLMLAKEKARTADYAGALDALDTAVFFGAGGDALPVITQIAAKWADRDVEATQKLATNAALCCLDVEGGKAASDDLHAEARRRRVEEREAKRLAEEAKRAAAEQKEKDRQRDERRRKAAMAGVTPLTVRDASFDIAKAEGKKVRWTGVAIKKMDEGYLLGSGPLLWMAVLQNGECTPDEYLDVVGVIVGDVEIVLGDGSRIRVPVVGRAERFGDVLKRTKG